MRDNRWCASCQECVPVTADKLCLWCDRSCFYSSRPRNQLGRRKLTDDQLRALHSLYTRGGMTLLGLARRVWKQAGYASERSARNNIRLGFKRLGLEIRPQQAGAGVSFCKKTVRQGPRKGRQCGLPPQVGSEWCYAHDPARAAEREAQLARMRALNHSGAIAA